MGSGRAGWYSDDRVGNDGHDSATEIIPTLQAVTPGMLFPSLPGARSSFVLTLIYPRSRPCIDRTCIGWWPVGELGGLLHLLLERFCRAQGETKGIKDFITVLMLYRDHKACEIEAAVELATQNHISTSEGVRHILAFTGDADARIAPLAAWPTLPPPDVAAYGQLGGVQ